MLIDSIHKECIWCKRRLIHSAVQVDCRESIGPRPRSEEHIIPKSLFGNILTTDVCRCCNNEFGSSYDHALVNDNLIVEAAQKAGFKVTDLWKSFDAWQDSSRGRRIKVAYRDGEFRPVGSYSDLNQLSVPIINGKMDEKGLVHFRARLIRKVELKSPHLTRPEIESRVSTLIANMRKDPTRRYEDPVLNEVVEPTSLGTEIKFQRQIKPWETHWCLAKMVYEFSMVLWPKFYRSYCGPYLECWHDFIKNKACSSDNMSGPGIFRYTELPADRAAKEHQFECVLSATEMLWKLKFFGTAQWEIGGDDHEPPPGNFPAARVRILIKNPFGPGSRGCEVTVEEA